MKTWMDTENENDRLKKEVKELKEKIEKANNLLERWMFRATMQHYKANSPERLPMINH